jgi:hypothetical protein
MLYSPKCLEWKFSEVRCALLDILERSESGLERAARGGALGARVRLPTQRPLPRVRPLARKMQGLSLTEKRPGPTRLRPRQPLLLSVFRGRSLFDQPPVAILCELRVRNVPRGQQSMSPAEGEASADEDCISDCKECSSYAEDVPSVICTLNRQRL